MFVHVEDDPLKAIGFFPELKSLPIFSCMGPLLIHSEPIRKECKYPQKKPRAQSFARRIGQAEKTIETNAVLNYNSKYTSWTCYVDYKQFYHQNIQ